MQSTTSSIGIKNSRYKSYTNELLAYHFSSISFSISYQSTPAEVQKPKPRLRIRNLPSNLNRLARLSFIYKWLSILQLFSISQLENRMLQNS
ncbi:uncharacterized protein J3R85_007846 [Psidium guajava]|nr:uncharacterized protein J3R85_007846 [Psidium guajava]